MKKKKKKTKYISNIAFGTHKSYG